MKKSKCCNAIAKAVGSETMFYQCSSCKQACDTRAEDHFIDDVNGRIKMYKESGDLDTEEISDGYHAFGELYKHRFALYIALAKSIQEGDREEYGFDGYTVIRSKIHEDGLNVWEDWGMFLLLMVNNETKEQISYHLDREYWDKCDFAETQEKAKIKFDGHSSEDVLKRLLKL